MMFDQNITLVIFAVTCRGWADGRVLATLSPNNLILKVNVLMFVMSQMTPAVFLYSTLYPMIPPGFTTEVTLNGIVFAIT
jgi:hypothetical protein